MSEFTDFLENELLDHVFGGAAYSAPASIWMGLYTSVCSDSARGTEVSTGGYGRQEIAFGSAASGTISNSGTESFTASGANFGTIVATGLEDAETTGNQLCFDNDFGDTDVDDGDTLQFGAGDIDVSLD